MTARKVRVPHPGYPCCDLAQDLAGWLAAEREKVAGARAKAREWRALGEKADAEALRCTVESADWRVQLAAEQARQYYHGEANAHAQHALIIEGQANRVEAAHAWRLK